MSAEDASPEVQAAPPPPGEQQAVRKRRRRRVKISGDNITHLNLTPMMDIMTMLLVFLVMSLASDPSLVATDADKLMPPRSSAVTPVDAATTITITADAILVESTEVAKVGEITKNRLQIDEVLNALNLRAEYLRGLSSFTGRDFDGRLLVVAHQTTPYWLVSSVLYSAGLAQFKEFKLVVQKQADDEKK